ncbi:MAG: hypothetical protein Q7R22_005655 [Verrucomicrobiota bacterium JB025]|nr:hypothetical protein [Verrucomicrobiota bacterium JB025]
MRPGAGLLMAVICGAGPAESAPDAGEPTRIVIMTDDPVAGCPGGRT